MIDFISFNGKVLVLEEKFLVEEFESLVIEVILEIIEIVIEGIIEFIEVIEIVEI